MQLWYHLGTEPDKIELVQGIYEFIPILYLYNDLEFNCTINKKIPKPKGNKLVFSLKAPQPCPYLYRKEIEIVPSCRCSAPCEGNGILKRSIEMKMTSLNLGFDLEKMNKKCNS